MSQSDLFSPEIQFRKVARKYSANADVIGLLWNEVAICYQEKGRHYHNLQHLADVLQQLEQVAAKEWDIVLFATIYHDIIYSTTAKDNEGRSAEAAQKALSRLTVPQAVIDEVVLCILATRHHEPTGNMTIDLFTDADMSILGRDKHTYAAYARNVRKEYSIYPDVLYNPGRKKALNSFLAMERIFKTEHFYDLYERRARENVAWEMGNL